MLSLTLRAQLDTLPRRLGRKCHFFGLYCMTLFPFFSSLSLSGYFSLRWRAEVAECLRTISAPKTLAPLFARPSCGLPPYMSLTSQGIREFNAVSCARRCHFPANRQRPQLQQKMLFKRFLRF